MHAFQFNKENLNLNYPGEEMNSSEFRLPATRSLVYVPEDLVRLGENATQMPAENRIYQTSI